MHGVTLEMIVQSLQDRYGWVAAGRFSQGRNKRGF